MLIKTLIIAMILIAIVMLALGIKLLFNKDAEFTMHSCALEDGENLDQEEACYKCQLKDTADCPEIKVNQKEDSKN